MKELSHEESRNITGGDLYEVGKAVGKWAANFVDEWEGIFQGIKDSL